MASFVYTEAKDQLLKGGINFASDDIRCAFVMTNTTPATKPRSKR